MSRILKKKIEISEKTKYLIKDNKIIFEGPHGTNQMNLIEGIEIKNDNRIISFTANNVKSAIAGSFIMRFANFIKGVEQKFEKTLQIKGVGYKVLAKGKDLEFFVGKSHTIIISAVEGIEFEIKSQVELVVRSVSKELLGDFVAKIKKIRKMNPYKTKGIFEAGQFILTKEGKK